MNGPIALLILLLASVFAPLAANDSDGVTWNGSDAPLAPFQGEGAVPRVEVSVAVDPTDPERMAATMITYGNPPQFCCSRGIWRVATACGANPRIARFDCVAMP